MKCLRCGNEMINILGGNWHCDTCGMVVYDLVNRGEGTIDWVHKDSISIPEDINITPVQPSYQPTGWICPKCGASCSPHTNVCPNCLPPQKLEFTC